MAIDETEPPLGSVGALGDDTGSADAVSRFAADDFRLRLDSPLFHRDPGMAAAQAPQLRELTWEHVVRPSQQVPVIHEGTVIHDDVVPSRSIESLLEHARDAEEPEPTGFADLLQPVEPLKPLESLSGEVPVVQVPVIEAPVIETPFVAEPLVDDTPFVDEWPVGQHVDVEPVIEFPLAATVTATSESALYSLDDDMEVVPVLPPAKPRVESLFAALDQLDEAQVVAPVEDLYEPVVDEPIVDVAPPAVQHSIVQQEPVQQEPVQQHHVQEVTPIAAVVATPAHTAPRSAVEAELNRLAFLPDQEEQPGPVVVPAIAYSEPRAESAPLPALSQHDLYTARNAAPANHARLNLVDVSTTFTPVARKKKRNGFLRFATFLIFVALLGGAAYAGKYYFLDKRWEGDAKALAGEVEEARGLSFDHAITVTALPTAEYAQRLVTSSFGMTEDELTEESTGWRALGLLNGALSLGQIGMAALPDSPAFYDSGTETIFVAQDLPENLYRFGMHRALALALLDQQFRWSDSIKDASPAIARGTRAYYDADALATAVAMETADQRTAIVTEIFVMLVARQSEVSPAPFATAVAGRLGLALRPYFESLSASAGEGERAEVNLRSPITDAQVLDIRRLVSGAVENPSVGAQGMLFWYHVLASRVDENTAWSAALAWQDDDMSVAATATGSCVIAHLQVDPAALDGVVAAFQGWAAAAPSASGTTVTLTSNGSPMQLQINACDPGAGVPTNAGGLHLSLGGAPLRAEQYRLLMEAQPTLPPSQAACAVHGGDPVSMADERNVVDNSSDFQGPANHPLPDPNRLGCAPV